jgi:putative addiction module component (TIGR02574 family)
MVRKELIEQILSLDTADREYVRDVLLASLTDESPELTSEDQQEILRRIDAYQKKPDSFVSWEHVKAQLAKERAGRST